MATVPPTSSAPSSVGNPNSMPTAWKAGRNANETPVRMGRPLPMRPNSGNCCRMVSMADRMSATWMMAVSCSSEKLHTPAMMMAGAMTPANDDSTCCRVMGMRSLTGGMPPRLNSAAFSSTLLACTSVRFCVRSCETSPARVARVARSDDSPAPSHDTPPLATDVSGIGTFPSTVRRQGHGMQPSPWYLDARGVAACRPILGPGPNRTIRPHKSPVMLILTNLTKGADLPLTSGIEPNG